MTSFAKRSIAISHSSSSKIHCWKARHILFQITPIVPLKLLREALLAEWRNNPDRFAELLKGYSNCASRDLLQFS
jgi:hypothetical protein